MVVALEVAQGMSCGDGTVLEEDVADWNSDWIRSKSEARHLDGGSLGGSDWA